MCIRFRQEPDTRTGVSNVDTPAMNEFYSIRVDLTTPSSILRQGIPRSGTHPKISPAVSVGTVHSRLTEPLVAAVAVLLLGLTDL